MSRISRNLSIILRSERLMAQRRIAVLRRQTAFMAAAGVVAGLGLIMLNVAAYLALSTWTSPAIGALIVAAVNLGLAAVLVSIASNVNLDAELAPVAEVRDIALEDLEAEVTNATTEARELAQNVRRMARDPFGIGGVGAAGALISALLRNTKE